MSDLRELEESQAPRKLPNRAMVLIAGLVALALMATLVFVILRPTGGGGTTGGAPSSEPPVESAGADTSAGKLLGWGEPNVDEEFDGPLGPEWRVYDGPGHLDNGIRSPQAVEVSDGVLTITGDSEGATGGLALFPGQRYGRWEGRVRLPPSDETYNALLLLWPDAENWPVGGEIDFMENLDPARQETGIYVHYDTATDQLIESVRVDATQWHNWAVEWTPERIVAYLDGREWFRTSEPEVLPPGPMHLAIQLDWFPGQAVDQDVQESTMEVDWIKQYSYDP